MFQYCSTTAAPVQKDHGILPSSMRAPCQSMVGHKNACLFICHHIHALSSWLGVHLILTIHAASAAMDALGATTCCGFKRLIFSINLHNRFCASMDFATDFFGLTPQQLSMDMEACNALQTAELAETSRRLSDNHAHTNFHSVHHIIQSRAQNRLHA